jgi:hypothetical protein
MDGIIELTTSRTQVECLPRELNRDSNGKVDCDLIWELPPNDSSGCSLPYLADVATPRSKKNDRGGRNCKVAQLSVKSVAIPDGNGFYDTFSTEREIDCRNATGATARIAYSASVAIPEGVRAFLDCSSK